MLAAAAAAAEKPAAAPAAKKSGSFTLDKGAMLKAAEGTSPGSKQSVLAAAESDWKPARDLQRRRRYWLRRNRRHNHPKLQQQPLPRSRLLQLPLCRQSRQPKSPLLPCHRRRRSWQQSSKASNRMLRRTLQLRRSRLIDG